MGKSTPEYLSSSGTCLVFPLDMINWKSLMRKTKDDVNSEKLDLYRNGTCKDGRNGRGSRRARSGVRKKWP